MNIEGFRGELIAKVISPVFTFSCIISLFWVRKTQIFQEMVGLACRGNCTFPKTVWLTLSQTHANGSRETFDILGRKRLADDRRLLMTVTQHSWGSGVSSDEVFSTEVRWRCKFYSLGGIARIDWPDDKTHSWTSRMTWYFHQTGPLGSLKRIARSVLCHLWISKRSNQSKMCKMQGCMGQSLIMTESKSTLKSSLISNYSFKRITSTSIINNIYSRSLYRTASFPRGNV